LANFPSVNVQKDVQLDLTSGIVTCDSGLSEEIVEKNNLCKKWVKNYERKKISKFKTLKLLKHTAPCAQAQACIQWQFKLATWLRVYNYM
jgi:hypothetical protein